MTLSHGGVHTVALVADDAQDLGWRFIDVNNDGLLDAVRHIETPFTAYNTEGVAIDHMPEHLIRQARHVLIGQAAGGFRHDPIASQVPFQTVVHLPLALPSHSLPPYNRRTSQ